MFSPLLFQSFDNLLENRTYDGGAEAILQVPHSLKGELVAFTQATMKVEEVTFSDADTNQEYQ